MLLAAVGMVSAVCMLLTIYADVANSASVGKAKKQNATALFFEGRPKQEISFIAEVRVVSCAVLFMLCSYFT